jgi:large subunit ribosomal protein L15
MRLEGLLNTTRAFKRRKRVGRGLGSKRGQTCCRGQKGAGSRSGWKSRERYEGGQLPLYRKIPARGFSNVQFQKKYDVINLAEIDGLYHDGEVVSLLTLREKQFLKGSTYGIKILGDGELTKKVNIEAQAYSKSAIEKLQASGIPFVVAE